ncbi:putative toxin-antitoxin system toxin component, PIN family [Azospirillum sp.]|uniref:putative toxin-antitoxin system toxin component, PIN family n=1 Tax=Azospirillum sp. TaxID=34012 RepID=UPI002D269BAB|nr:putative toxin-antitoxin system toxin component, PIN family [Azospirillum sp.]HYD68655.1 putative toxin-antitoxin system toxin component, PIN family [Azospirillum sp.]
MPNVVFDASALVSALLWRRSVPAQALLAGYEFDVLAYSDDTLEELATVLERPKFAAMATLDERERFLGWLRAAGTRYEPTERVTACRDAKDNKYLELAKAAEAWAIVTGDADLLVLHPFGRTSVLRPAAYLAALQARLP